MSFKMSFKMSFYMSFTLLSFIVKRRKDNKNHIPYNRRFYIALHNVARIQPGETVLIHSASRGTGQAAIQIAKNAGATIFATVSSEL